ncbi:MAG: FAD-dependent oxidoreductase [Nitrososphaerota archaeon]|nr:FAD-dependent oxidoreductase [Candidatus Bathyarchaeota archaeon]MDW8194509.1 FAD-dependent oxidoreductase [Nitrososphaerota archaeon]
MCPLRVDIPEFIKLVRLGNYGEAAEKIRQKNCMPSVCGRVCPPRSIMRHGVQKHHRRPDKRSSPRKVRSDLELETGAAVPEVAPSTGKSVGKTLTIDDLFEEGFNAVFLDTGAGLPKLLGIPGENLCGVYSLNEFLLRINLMKADLFPYKSKTPIKVRGRVAILGARGMDAARSALRLGAEEACIFYQRKVVGRVDDIRRGLEEGVKLHSSTKPVRLIGDEKRWVKLVELVKLKPGPPDRTGKLKLIPEQGSEFLYSAETVIIATEHIPNTIAAASTKRSIKIAEKNKTIIVNQETLEAVNGIFAGGDVVSGAASVIKAIEAGKKSSPINKHIHL